MGLVEDTRLPDKQKHLYLPTDSGIQSYGPRETDCSLPLRKKSLFAAVQKAFDCASCLAAHDRPITRPEIAQCLGIGLDTARYRLTQLVNHGYLTSETRKGGATQYAFTDNKPSPPESCFSDITNRSQPAKRPARLTSNQQKVLDCTSCQTAQELVPNFYRTSLCTGLNSQAVNNTVSSLVSRKLARLGERQNSGIHNAHLVQNYHLADIRATKPVLMPDCNIAERVAETTHNKLPPERRRMLGCLACIQDNIKQGTPLPGASYKLLSDCGGWPLDTVKYFMSGLCTAGYYAKEDGYKQSALGRVFFRPTSLGRVLLRYHQKQQAVPPDCKTDFSAISEAPVRTRDEIIKCIGCIWTQQVASNCKPAASARMISACRGFSQSDLSKSILPAMADQGLLRRIPPRSPRQPITYTPPGSLPIPLGLGADCRLKLRPDIDLGLLMDSLPADVFSPYALDDSLHAFEAFVDGLRTAPQPGSEIAPEANHGIYRLKVFMNYYPVLTAEEEAHYSLVIQTSRDPALVEKATATLILSNIRLALWMAHRTKFETAVTSFEETFQAALFGITEAAKTFDSRYATKFSVHAYWLMRKEIQTVVSERYGAITAYVARIPSMLARAHQFREDYNREPNILELAALLSLQPSEVRKVLMTHQSIVKRSTSVHSETEQRIAPKGYVDMQAADAEVNSLFTVAKDYLHPVEKAMLEQIVIHETSTLEEFVQEWAVPPNEAHAHFASLLSKLKHPYFGFGAALDSQNLAWQAKAQCARDNISRVVHASVIDPHTKATCLSCPVNTTCDSYASDKQNKVVTGIWGGKVRSFA